MRLSFATLLVLLLSLAAAAAAPAAPADLPKPGLPDTPTPATDLPPPVPASDCAEPTRANFANQLAEEADIVVSGLAISMGPDAAVCAADNSNSNNTRSGADLQVQEAQQEDGSQVLLFWAQCVHKGALVCRQNEVDNTIKPPRCVIAVRVPAQAQEAGQLPPCTVSRGFRYTLLLSSKPAASCDGAYDMYNARITQSIRTHLGMKACAPYPSWPSQDTQINGTGLAAVLGRTCSSATATEAVQCAGESDPCTGKAACAEETAVACVPKACVGKYMVNDLLLGTDACQPVFISQVTGLPVASCDITQQRLARQARQTEKRLSTASSSNNGGGDAAPPSPRLGSVLGGPSKLGPLPVLNGDSASP